jgi:Flp pilus assembly protein TadB
LLPAILAFGFGWFLTSPADQRWRRLQPTRSAARHRPQAKLETLVENTRARVALCCCGGGGLGWLLAGVVGAVAGAAAGVLLASWVGTLQPPSVTKRRAELAKRLPLAADLMAAGAAAGGPVECILPIAAKAVGGAFSAAVMPVLARIELGADPVSEWSAVCADEGLAPLGRTMCRTLQSGAPLAAALNRLADDCRRERRQFLQRRARSVGVKAAGPLAACFLPAFVLIGIVPTVAGAFQRLIF